MSATVTRPLPREARVTGPAPRPPLKRRWTRFILPAYSGLREGMEHRRRSRSAPERILERLLGLDLKLRQYELGGAFCDAVVREAGMEALGRVWSSPEALPTLQELSQPADWLERSGAPEPAA